MASTEMSQWIHHQLDCVGYSYEMTAIRRNVYRAISKLYTTKYKQKIILSGSKGEGTTKRFESDADILHFVKNGVCIDDLALLRIIPANIAVFTILNTEPGYCKLELLRQGTKHNDFIINCLVEIDGKVMLSSEKIRRKGFEHWALLYQTSLLGNGPAACTRLPQYGYQCSLDRVLTLPCVCRPILEDWAKRLRTNDWPAQPLRQSILQMTGNLVATGPDDNETKHLGWRYCFNEIEILILATLNDTQLKLYKVLKIINTYIFKRRRGLTLTSFIMKNIVFWLAETHPQSQFLPETLFHWVCQAMGLLKHYVETNNIPYYMIPGRNLLKEKVKESQRPKLIQVITDIVQPSSILTHVYELTSVIRSGPVVTLFMAVPFEKHSDLADSEISAPKQKLKVLELFDFIILYYQALLRCIGRDSQQDVLFKLLTYRQRQIFRSGRLS